MLSLAVGISQAQGGFTPDVGRDMWVLRDKVEVALARGGFQSSPAGSVTHSFFLACQRRMPECERGVRALMASSAKLLKTDASGHAQTAALPAGRYYVFGAFSLDNRNMIWNVPVDLRGTATTITLDQHNGSPLQ